MRREEYPAQEPLSEAGERYSSECWRRGQGVATDEEAYGNDPYQRLLIAPSAKPDGRVLVFWHGGGWTSGYKEWMAFMAPVFTGAGVTFVSPGYRLAPQHLFPAGLDDCAAALRWVYGNIRRFGGQRDRIYVGGHSAGGHYAALLAVRRDWQATLALPVDVIKGCLPISGVYQFTEDSGLSNRPRFLGPSGNEREASPIHNLQPPLPRFLIAYGSEDFPHLIKQADRFADDAGGAGAIVERLAMPGRNHFTASYAAGDADGPWVGPALRFVN